MFKKFGTVMLLMLVGASGCYQGTPGGPGTTVKVEPGSATVPAKKPVYGLANNTFNLSVPLLPTTLNQGETKDVSISLKRGTDFDEDVSVKFADLPKGVTIEPARPVIKHGDTEAKLSLKALSDASIGDFTVHLTGHPTKGGDASVDFKISVGKK